MNKKFAGKVLVWILLLVVSQTNCSNQSQTNKPPLFRVVNIEPRPSQGMGNVKGTVLWSGDGKGIADVEVLLCERISMTLFFSCEGKNFKTKSDAEGIYWFKDIPPGSYSFAIKPPGATNTYVSLTTNYATAQSMRLESDQTIEVEPQKIYKMDLKPITPKTDESIQERKPTLRWETYPGAKSYYVTLYKENAKIELNDNGGKAINNTEVTPLNELPNGKYKWRIHVFDDKANAIAYSEEGVFTFNVVDSVESKKKEKQK